jgi:hypothetical protein
MKSAFLHVKRDLTRLILHQSYKGLPKHTLSQLTFAKVEKIITKLYSEVRAKYTYINSLHCSMQVNDEQLSLLNSYTSKIYPPPNLKYIIYLFFQNKTKQKNRYINIYFKQSYTHNPNNGRKQFSNRLSSS